MPLDDDLIVRSALYPKILDEDTGLIAPEQIVAPFSPIVFDDGVAGFALSVGARRMLPTDAAIHDFGCRVAAVANDRRAAAAQDPLIRGRDTFHYRGSYELEVDQVLAIETDLFHVEIEACPENGLDEHCHIELRPRNAETSKNKLSKERTTVIAQLYRLLKRPVEHVCDCDADLRELLEAIRLPDIQSA